nr:PREDICTED: G-protein coupled receptor 20 [Equus przewalskii]
MPSASTAGPLALAAPNATVAAAAWANSSAPEVPLFHLFALLDEELHAAFPGLWLALVAVHGVIFLAGLVLNGLALYVFCCRTRAKTPSVIYTINLVVTDLLVGLSLPTRFAVFYGTRGCLRCAFPHVFSYFLNMHCSILFLTCICVDRYLAIVQPDGSRRWRQPACARVVCALVWLAAGAVTLSVLGVTAGGRPCCHIFALTVLEFLLPLLVISVFTGRIVCALSRPGLLRQGRQRRVRAMQLLLTDPWCFAVNAGEAVGVVISITTTDIHGPDQVPGTVLEPPAPSSEPGARLIRAPELQEASRGLAL